MGAGDFGERQLTDLWPREEVLGGGRGSFWSHMSRSGLCWERKRQYLEEEGVIWLERSAEDFRKERIRGLEWATGGDLGD